VIELPPGRPCLSSEDLNRLIRQQAIGRALVRTLLIDEIVRSVPLEAAESEQLIERFLQDHQHSDADPRQAYLDAEGIDDSDLCWRATTERRLQIHCHRQHGEDVESLYLERKLELDQVIYSLIRVADADLAAELHQQIVEGEADFGSLARLHSLGAERFRRGLVGPVPLAAAHPDLLHRLRSGEPGQLWEPFFVVDVWLLVRLEERLPAELDAALRQRLEKELFERWLEARVQAFLAGEELARSDVG
jgi:parvulin-like peptidyl-prolyl isomerase